MADCIFCKIVEGSAPCYKIYEDEYALAFLDISKDCYGHTLVVPKKHFKNVLDCDELYLAKTFTSKREKKSRDLEAEVLKIFDNAKRYDRKIFAKFKKEKNNVIVIMGAGNLLESIKGILKT